MCGQGWSRPQGEPRHPCTGCGERIWDTEPDLSYFIGEGTEYRVTEVETDPHLVMRLVLVWPLNRGNNAQVRLPHRLKETFRHAVQDHAQRGGIGLMVKFARAEGRWGLFVRVPTPFEERRWRTDDCRRHKWALGIVLPPFDINAFADRIHCTCPVDPPCEVCMLAAQFAEDRRRPGSIGDRYVAELQNAVNRDLGRL
jgi:hypothetical protein